jgi:nascent polypeptide-associated complex subunit alpha
MSKVNSRRARRMMKNMGLNMDEMPDIELVILQGPKREIIIEGATITSLNVQGQKMFQIVGGKLTENTVEKKIEIPEEDVLLVSQQTGVSMERARVALKESDGDLAKAILMITTS